MRLVATRLGREHPGARTALEHRDAFELLVATVLSAQTTDVRVNEVTSALFPRWPDAGALAGADQEEVERIVRPLGMGPTRARRIRALAADLVREHDGEVPDGQEALEALPGVGRKTALVVRGVWFGQDALAVDTHVGRLARRLGWTRASDPRRVEEDVSALVRTARSAGTAGTGTARDDRIDLTALSLRLILHGREVCTARTPHCERCVLADVCPRVGVA